MVIIQNGVWGMKKERRNKLELYIGLLTVFFLAVAIYWHPWINQGMVDKSFEKFYGSKPYKVVLTNWNPFGQEFEVKTYGNITVGRGLVNLWGDVTEFEFVWEGKSIP